MNKSLKLALLLFAGLLLAAAFFILQVPQTKAENGVTATEHAELYVNDLAGFVADGGTRDAATGNITIEVVGDGAGDFTVDFSGFDSLTVNGQGKTIGAVSLTASGANKKTVTFRDITVEKKHRGYCPL